MSGQTPARKAAASPARPGWLAFAAIAALATALLGASGTFVAGAIRFAGWWLALLLTGCAVAPAAQPVSPPPPSVSAPASTAAVGPTSTPAASPTPSAPPLPTGPAETLTGRDWKLIAKDPDAASGRVVQVFGHVVQFDAATGRYGFRADVDGVRHDDWYDYDVNTVLIAEPELLADLVEGDLFRAEAVIRGSMQYETTLGGQMTVPQLYVRLIEVIGQRD